MRHLAGSSASCRRAVGLTLSTYDVLGGLRFGFRSDGRQLESYFFGTIQLTDSRHFGQVPQNLFQLANPSSE
jgi:hypothetical protein